MRELLDKSSEKASIRRDIEALIEGKTISKSINEQLTYSEINGNIDNIWSLMYMTGYLTTSQRPSGGRYDLCIPNREVREIYQQQVLSWLKDKVETETGSLAELYSAFEACDTSKIEALLYEQLRYTVSFHDAYESFYHGFLLALLANCAEWDVSSNIETGTGRCDILVERDDYELGFVVELKVVKMEDQLDKACADAMDQIERRRYADILRKDGVRKMLAYGIAFWDKRCKVVVKKIDE